MKIPFRVTAISEQYAGYMVPEGEEGRRLQHSLGYEVVLTLKRVPVSDMSKDLLDVNPLTIIMAKPPMIGAIIYLEGKFSDPE